MAGHQKRTYLVYSRGIMPSSLRLGGLYVDPANPTEGEHKRFECPLDPRDMQKWLSEPEIDEPYNLNFMASRQWIISAGIIGLLGAKARKQQAEQVLVSGSTGRRFQINKPESFLNQVVLSSPHARVWLTQQLSISRKMYYTRKALVGIAKDPKIWLLTGIQYISEASATTAAHESNLAAFKATTPAPDPVAAAVSIRKAVSGPTIKTASHVSASTKIAFHHRDERVWAAQFTPLNVKFSQAGHGQSSAAAMAEEMPEAHRRITLRDIPDLGSSGVRAGHAITSPNDDSHVRSDEFALVEGLDESNTEQWDEEPGSQLSEMEDVDWNLMDQYWEEMEESDED